MQDRCLHMLIILLSLPYLGSAYYIVTTVTTIELPPFPTDLPEIYDGKSDTDATAFEMPPNYAAKSDCASEAQCTGSSTQKDSSNSPVETSVPCSSSTSLLNEVEASISGTPCSSSVLALSVTTESTIWSTDISTMITTSLPVTSCAELDTKSETILITSKPGIASIGLTVKTSLAASSTTSAACSSTSTANITNTNFPPFPLSENTSTALTAFLQLLLSIPESIFEKGDTEISSFFTGMGNCMANNALGLKTDLKNIILPITNFVADFGTNLLTGLQNGAATIGEDIENIGDTIGSVFKISKRDTFGDLLSDIENIRACMSNVANNNTVFDVANCALGLAELLQPATRLAKISTLISTAGGVGKTVSDLKKGSSVQTIAKDSLNVLEEALGIADAVQACGFVAEKVLGSV